MFKFNSMLCFFFYFYTKVSYWFTHITWNSIRICTFNDFYYSRTALMSKVFYRLNYKLSSPSWIWTNDQMVNSHLLYHWAIEDINTFIFFLMIFLLFVEWIVNQLIDNTCIVNKNFLLKNFYSKVLHNF